MLRDGQEILKSGQCLDIFSVTKIITDEVSKVSMSV